jgi:Xaa-Pro aminopeptidase
VGAQRLVDRLAMLGGRNESQRLDGARELMGERGLEALIVTKPPNIRYLTGFSGSLGIVVVTATSSTLIVDPRYDLVAEADTFAVRDELSVLVGPRRIHFDNLRRLTDGLARVGVEEHFIDASSLQSFQSGLSPSVLPANRVVEELRLVKDEGEIARLRAAAAITDAAVCDMANLLPLGLSESEFCRLLDDRLRALGAADRSFPTIVVSGLATASPHGFSSATRIEEGQPVIVDVGAVVGGYHSDMTRTIWYGSLSPEVALMYEATLAANDAARASAVVGASHADLYWAARRVFIEAGFPDDLAHPAGHNIGLEVHELPYLTADADQPLRSGSVVAIEPALYARGVGGVRIEDMVVVREEGPETVTRAPKLSPGKAAPATPGLRPDGTGSARVEPDAPDEHRQFLTGSADRD